MSREGASLFFIPFGALGRGERLKAQQEDLRLLGLGET